MGRRKLLIDPVRGERLGELLNENGLTQKSFADSVDISPVRLNKIIKGTNQLTEEVADIVISRFPKIRKAYLLNLDNFKTEDERAAAIIKTSVNCTSCVEQLIVLHGYSIEEQTDSRGKIRIALTSPYGSVKYFSSKEYLSFLRSLNDSFEGQLLFQTRQLTDRAKEYW